MKLYRPLLITLLLVSSVSFGAMSLNVPGYSSPATIQVGQTITVEYLFDGFAALGAVEWVGVGDLGEPQYLDPPYGIDPPVEPFPNWWFLGYTSPEILPPGVFATSDYVSTVTGTVTLYLYDDAVGYEDPIDSFEIIVVPEPATLLLLVSGLLLIRKRR